MQIPFVDLRPQHSLISTDILQALCRVFESGIYLYGPEVEAFEDEWAAYCGQRYCVACANGTDAIRIIASSLDAPPLYVPANTTRFSRVGLETSLHPRIAGAIDVWPETGWPNGWPSRTMPVLLYGRHLPAGEAIGCHVVDACQAHGWKPPAGVIAAWSFYPSKNLGALSDGGAVTLNNEPTAQIIRSHAKAWHSRLSEKAAAVLRVKLKHLDFWNVQRAAIAELYYHEMTDRVKFACTPGWPTNHHIFAILTERRDELQACLKEYGVETKVHYPQHLGTAHTCKGARSWCSRTLSLPCWPGMLPQDVQYVCEVIRTFFRR